MASDDPSGRFQKFAGFDRAIALASVSTATIPLVIAISTLSSQLGSKDTAERIIDRYELTGLGIIGFFLFPGSAPWRSTWGSAASSTPALGRS